MLLCCACSPSLAQQYNPELDRKQFEEEVKRLSYVPEANQEMGRMHVVDEQTFKRLSQGAV